MSATLDRRTDAAPRLDIAELRRTAGPLQTLALLRRTVRNPMDSWPPQVYTHDLVRTRFLKRTNYFVTAPDLIQQVMVQEHEKLVKAEPMRRALEPALGQGILTSEGARWRLHRRIAAPVFRPAALDSFIPAFLAGARATRAAWLALPDGTPLEVGREMMHLTFEIILETMLSGRGDVDVARVERSIADFLESSSWSIVLSALRAPEWTPFPGKYRAARGGAYLRRFVTQRAADRRATGERHDDLLSLMLDATDPDTGEAMPDADIVDNILTFIGAGHETTALALTWTFYALSHHPEIEARMLAEIEAVTGGGELTPEQVHRLTYVRQVVSESMRLYPPVAMVVRNATEPFDLAGHRVEPGDGVFVPIRAVHRHAKLWDSPETFDPERFTPEAVRARHRFAWLPFGAGPRICIGLGFSLLEAVAILGTLLPAIRVQVNPDYVPVPKVRITMRPAEGMPVTIEKR